MINYQSKPAKVVNGENREIYVFDGVQSGSNIDNEVVESFGVEWSKFKEFKKNDLEHAAAMYFDILTEQHLNQDTYAMDMGCGTGRWTKMIADRVRFVEAVDPSEAIFVADRLLKDKKNIRLTQASSDTLPFADETFDFVMSIGVLHHIPDTGKAMRDCVKKVKKGGYFYTYLYYDLDNKGPLFRLLFSCSNVIRFVVSRLPHGIKKFVCDLLAVLLYMPFVLAGRLLKRIGLKKLADKLPLNIYQDQSFYIIRNDALDRFGTKLEQRFTRKQVEAMMREAGLDQIVISPGMPYWHAVGTRI